MGKRKGKKKKGGSVTDTKPKGSEDKKDSKPSYSTYSVTTSFSEEDPPEKVTQAAEDSKWAELIEVPELTGRVGFPCFLATGDVEYINKEEMPCNICYIIAGNGTFMYKKNALHNYLTKVDGVGSLADIREYCWYQEHSIPEDLVRQIVGFFKKVYDEHKSEAILLLYFNQKTAEWLALVPKQTVSGASANYQMVTPDMVPDGFSRVGTWHSHANMSAFFSGVDDHDDERDDGVHLTIGDLGNRWGQLAGNWMPSIVASYATNGQRWTAEPQVILDAPIKVLKEKTTKSYLSGNKKDEENEEREYVFKYEDTDDLSFPAEWLEKVEHMSIVHVSHSRGSGSRLPFSQCNTTGIEDEDDRWGFTYSGCNVSLGGCEVCLERAIDAEFDRRSDVTELGKQHKDIVEAFQNIDDISCYTEEGRLQGLTEEYLVAVRGVRSVIEEHDPACAKSLTLADLLWCISVYHDEDKLEYFDRYIDWWIVNRHTCGYHDGYCLNPKSEANRFQKYAPNQFEAINAYEQDYLDCGCFYPTGGYSWDASKWNSVMADNLTDVLSEKEEEVVVTSGITCCECEKYKSTIEGIAEGCERYVELIDKIGKEAAEKKAWDDEYAKDCADFKDWWSSDSDCPFEGEPEEKELLLMGKEELQALVNEGRLSVDDYASIISFQESTGGGYC